MTTTASLVARQCRLCGRTPLLPDDPSRRPLVARHDPLCLVATDAARQVRADAAELARRPAGAVVVRGLTSGERISIGALRGTLPVPASVARQLRVRVLDVGGGLLLRAVEHRGRVWSVEVVAVEPSG